VVVQLIGIEVLIDGLVKSLSDSGCVLSILRLSSLVAGGLNLLLRRLLMSWKAFS
jgi:hypothetical protein